MTTTIVAIRQRFTAVLLLAVGTATFMSLLMMTGTMGHVLSIFHIDYNTAFEIVVAIINNAINSLPWYLQPLAHAVAGAVIALYKSSGLAAAIAY